MSNNYYVYVLIDPRNFEEFYYGKGKDDRKNEHEKEAEKALAKKADGESKEDFNSKVTRINKIKKAGLRMITRVIAKDLTNEQALLVEKTLIWKLGKYTTNISSGHFSDKFRPHNTIYKDLSGFDFTNKIHFFNVGDQPKDKYISRSWEDSKKYSFISAGQGVEWRETICKLNEGDIIAAYLSKFGYVGVGRVIKKAIRIQDIKIDKTPLLSLELKSKNLDLNADDNDKSEYVALVEWIKAVDRSEAKKYPGIFFNISTRALLEAHRNKRQFDTIEYLEREFSVKFDDLLNRRTPYNSL